jgi:ligand-binding sensor domain-containing protein/anti-sigma regulatory factor (Ser/Thr protein kinase)
MLGRCAPLVIALLFLGTVLAGQTRQVQTYSVQEGLAQSQVYAVLADRHAYIWAGTQGGGLSRFDGQRFRTFSERDGLGGNYVQALWEDAVGDLWVGTENGLVRFDGQVFYPVPEVEGKVLSIDATANDELWVLTTEQVYQRDASGWHTHGLPRRYTVAYQLLVEGARTLLATDRGLWQWRQGRWTLVPGDYESHPQVWHLYRYQRGYTHALSPSGAAFLLRSDSLIASTCPAAIPTTYFIDRGGSIWVGSQTQGLFCLEKGSTQWRRYGTRQGLGSRHVRSITEDAWGNIWVGCSGGGLSVLKRAPFQAFDTDRGLPAREVYHLYTDDSLGLLFSVNGAGIFRQSATGPVPFLQASAVAGLPIKSFVPLAQGDSWLLGTPRQGILCYADSAWQDVKACGLNVLDLLPRGPASVWVATAYEGLSLLDLQADSMGWQVSCQTYGSQQGIPPGRINGLSYNQAGELLIHYRNRGVACWKPGGLQWHRHRGNGLPTDEVRDLRQDSVGYYWLATPRGLLRLEPDGTGEVLHWTTAQGLSSNNLYSLVVDREQQLWAGTERGVMRLRLDAAHRPVQITTFGVEAGFTGVENCTAAAQLGPDGQAWFGTMHGLMKYAPAGIRRQNPPPPALAFKRVEVDFRSVRDSMAPGLLNGWGQVQGELQLDYQQNDLGFTLAARDLAQPDSVRYQWQLVGWEEQWTPWSANPEVRYANLPPGDYLFRARASRNGQQLSPILELPVQIIPAFWQTAKFRYGLLASVILLLVLLLWWWLRHWQARQQAVQERLALDNRLLELEHKALQLQMNPHFLANVLQAIQQAIKVGKHREADRYLHKFNQLMRSMLHHSRSTAVPLSQELELLRHYLDLEQYRSGQRFVYDILHDPELETDLIHIPPMLLQPFLENAVKHGMGAKTSGGRITLQLNDRGDYLEATIEDNGPGLEVAARRRPDDHRSTALQVIRERLALLSPAAMDGGFRLESLTDAGQVCGTRVRVSLPIIAS